MRHNRFEVVNLFAGQPFQAVVAKKNTCDFDTLKRVSCIFSQPLRGNSEENLVVAENHGGRYAVFGLEPEDLLSRRILLCSAVVL